MLELKDVLLDVGMTGIPGAVFAALAAFAVGDGEPFAKLRKETRAFPGDRYSPRRYVDAFRTAITKRVELKTLGILPQKTENARDLVVEGISPIEKTISTGAKKTAGGTTAGKPGTKGKPSQTGIDKTTPP